MAAEGVPFALTMSVTPPLAAMMKDELLRQRFHEHLARLEALAEQREKRLWGDDALRAGRHLLQGALRAGCAPCGTGTAGDVVAGLVRHWDAGRLELLTCSATHCYLPGMLPAREGIRPQLELGVRGFERLVGRRPDGRLARRVRLPPELRRRRSPARASASPSSTRTASRTRARVRPSACTRPSCSPSGVAFFGRDAESSKQVWSRDEGYPGDAYYRDFYRDIGFDLPERGAHGRGRRRRLAPDDGPQVLPHHRQGRREGAVPARASRRERAREHAGNFVFNRAAQVRHLRERRCRCRPSSSRRTTRSSSGTGGSRGRCSSRRCSARLRETRRRASRPITLRAVPRAPPGRARRRRRARARGARAATARSGSARRPRGLWRHVHHATRYAKWLVEQASRRRRARGRGARPGHPRAPAPAVERLAVHLEDGHRHPLRRGAHPVARAPAAAPRPPASRRGASRARTRPGSTTCAGATTSSRQLRRRRASRALRNVTRAWRLRATVGA